MDYRALMGNTREREGTPTPELHQHGMVIEEVTQQGKRRSRVLTQTPMDYYLHRGIITPREHEAGEMFWAHYRAAGFMRPSVPSYESIIMSSASSGGSGFLCGSEKQQYAMQRWRKAHTSIQGEAGRVLAVNVCCWGYQLKEVLSQTGTLTFTGYTGANAMPRLREALHDLAKHYGLPNA